jgi:hypothetical protein
MQPPVLVWLTAGRSMRCLAKTSAAQAQVHTLFLPGVSNPLKFQLEAIRLNLSA